jgi:glycosyltransferase involved in cell wall biosynthesis
MSAKEAETSITLSAVIPVGGFPNGDKALKSWLLQKLPTGLEVILVLDSDDKSVNESVRNMASSDYGNSVIVRESKFRNPGSTREIGLKAARGEWVCFWDSDDLPEVSNVYRNASLEENKSVDAIVGGYQSVDYETKKTTSHHHRAPDPLMEIYINPGLWRFIFRTQVVKDISFPALSMGEDQVFLFKAISASRKLNFVSENFYNYLQYSTGQLTKSNAISSDLAKARDLCKELYTNDRNPYLLSAIIRQDLTLIKRDKPLGKLSALGSLIKVSIKSIFGLKALSRILKVVSRGK